MRRLTAFAFVLLASAAQAQTPLTGTTGPLTSPPPSPSSTPIGRGSEQVAPPAKPITTGRAHHHRRTLQERFDEANTTHDGHLTFEQARAKMPSVARDFAAIDTANTGYVTIDQIRDHTKQVRATRRAARAAFKTPQ